MREYDRPNLAPGKQSGEIGVNTAVRFVTPLKKN